MKKKPTYQDLERQLMKLEKEVSGFRQREDGLLKANRELENTNTQLETAIERANSIAFEAEVGYIELNHLFNTAADGMCLIDRDFNMLRMNETFSKLFGLDQYGATGKKCYDVLAEANCHTPECPLRKILDGADRVEHDVVKTLYDGATISCIMTASAFRDPNREIMGLVINYKDITYRKQMEDKLRQMATIDGLTNVFNRRHFLVLSKREFSRSVRFNHVLSLMMIDADHFKKINDEYGHDVGDTALRALAQTAQSNLRDIDILGRIGGEEFAAVLPETDLQGAVRAAERLRTAVEKISIPTDGNRVSLTISVGVATAAKDVGDLESLMKLADIALYAAKTKGRNRVEHYKS